MKWIKRFEERVNISGSYLDEPNTSSASNKTVKKSNLPFGGTNLATGNKWDIKFDPSGIEHEGNDIFKVQFSEPIFKIISKEKKIDIEKVKKYLSNIKIECESVENFRRTHFTTGLPEEMQGLGLGYIIYEAFIKHLGFASSKFDASSSARKVWKKLSSDPDFYGMSIPTRIFLFYKDIFNGGNEELEKKKSLAIKSLTYFFDKAITKEIFGDILKSIDTDRKNIKKLKSILDEINEKIKFTIDLELFEMCPELVKIFFNHLDYIKNFDEYNKIYDEVESELKSMAKDKGIGAMAIRYNESMERLKDKPKVRGKIRNLIKDILTDSLKSIIGEFSELYMKNTEEAKKLYTDKLLPKEKEILSIIDKYKLQIPVTDKMKVSYYYDKIYQPQEKVKRNLIWDDWYKATEDNDYRSPKLSSEEISKIDSVVKKATGTDIKGKFTFDARFAIKQKVTDTREKQLFVFKKDKGVDNPLNPIWYYISVSYYITSNGKDYEYDVGAESYFECNNIEYLLQEIEKILKEG